MDVYQEKKIIILIKKNKTLFLLENTRKLMITNI